MDHALSKAIGWSFSQGLFWIMGEGEGGKREITGEYGQEGEELQLEP